ncbi:MAG: hypothetical protein IAI49_02035, partial [Candidatus Eremiobacteraeota bacterium]|nr:hypothetical protein [Candidatus Eremiobacteraeota bacterium]
MSMKRSPYRKAIPLFEDRALAQGPHDDLRDRLREFARAVARRHRRSEAGVAEFQRALRGYYRTLSICEGGHGRLDEALVTFATSEYLATRSN